jgi:hypothetical protein
MFKPHGLCSGLLLLLVPSVATAQQNQDYYLDLALGLGVGTLTIALSDDTTHKTFGSLVMADARVFHPTNHGMGLRLSGLQGASLFGEKADGAFFADLGYALHHEPRQDFHVAPSFLLGPSYVHYSAVDQDDEPPDCTLGCEPSPLYATSHHALGAAAALSFDLHGGTLFGGFDLGGRYGFALGGEPNRRNWGITVLLRLGASVPLRRARAADTP